jgi:alkanesulfonate monooxygenase SsuD/methylene tetrahydromethanopterin reductase-like flavin-dependent oxidoreductase (luciferase family)
MRLGIGLPDIPGVSGETLIDWISRVDESPFETLAVVDEIVSDSYEGTIMLATAAAITRHTTLMSTVIAGPLRNTALLAKQAASIDALSGGRLSLGLGVGDLVEDFAAVGVEMRGRGERFDEQLARMKRIWTGEPMGESGRAIGPPPARPGGPELLLGGWAPRAMARIGRFADGYVGAVLAEEMISDEPYRLAERSWREHQRPGKPRFVQNVHYALGPNAEDALDAYIRYNYADPNWSEYVPGILEVSPRTDLDVRRMLERLESIGVDEVVFHPVSSQIDQLERLEQALG